MNSNGLYIRQGRYFVRIPQHVGEYINKNGVFTKERQSDSVGRCVMQNGTICTIAELDVTRGISCDEATKIAEEQGKHLPSQQEVCALVQFVDFKHDHCEWTKQESSSLNAWFWRWLSSYPFAYFFSSTRSYDGQEYCARFFYNVNAL